MKNNRNKGPDWNNPKTWRGQWSWSQDDLEQFEDIEDPLNNIWEENWWEHWWDDTRGWGFWRKLKRDENF